MVDQKTTQRRIHCSWCGEDLGGAPDGSSWRDIESCGSAECNRECRGMEREQDEQARYEAEADGYSRYGGSGW
jgi:hypothetical protein